MHKHIRHAVLDFICSIIWIIVFVTSDEHVGMLNHVLHGFLAIIFFLNGIMEIRNHKKSQNLNQKKNGQ